MATAEVELDEEALFADIFDEPQADGSEAPEATEAAGAATDKAEAASEEEAEVKDAAEAAEGESGVSGTSRGQPLLAVQSLLPPGTEGRQAALLRLSDEELRKMLESLRVPTEGEKPQLIVRIIRKLAGWEPTEDDAPLFAASAAVARLAGTARGGRGARGARCGQGGRGRGAGASKPPLRTRRCKIVSDKKVGILPKPDAGAKVKVHLPPGEVFDVSTERRDPKDGRRYWKLVDGRGWVPECSRKDASKVVAALEAVETNPETEAPSKASQKTKVNAGKEDQPPKAAEEGMEAEVQVVMKRTPLRDLLSAEVVAAPEPEPLDPIAAAEATAAAEAAAVEAAEKVIDTINQRISEAKTVSEISKLERALKKFQVSGVVPDFIKNPPRKAVPAEEEQHKAEQKDQASEAPDLSAEVEEAAADEATGPQRGRGRSSRGRGRRRLVKEAPLGEVADEPQDGTGAGDVPGAELPEGGDGDNESCEKPKVRAKSSAARIRKVDRPGTEIGADGDIEVVLQPVPDDVPPSAADKFRALTNLPIGELRQMLKQVWLPDTGAKKDLAIRLVRELDGLPPTEADAPLFQVHAKILALKSGGRDKVVRSGEGEDEDEDGGAQETGPHKADIEAFVREFIEHTDVENTKLRDLNEALFQKFGELRSKQLYRARKIAAKTILARACEAITETAAEGQEAEVAPELGEDLDQTGEKEDEAERAAEGFAAEPGRVPTAGDEEQDLFASQASQKEPADEGSEGLSKAELKAFVIEFLSGRDLEATRVRDFLEALQSKHGELESRVLDRARRYMGKAIQMRLEGKGPFAKPRVEEARAAEGGVEPAPAHGEASDSEAKAAVEVEEQDEAEAEAEAKAVADAKAEAVAEAEAEAEEAKKQSSPQAGAEEAASSSSSEDDAGGSQADGEEKAAAEEQNEEPEGVDVGGTAETGKEHMEAEMAACTEPREDEERQGEGETKPAEQETKQSEKRASKPEAEGKEKRRRTEKGEMEQEGVHLSFKGAGGGTLVDIFSGQSQADSKALAEAERRKQKQLAAAAAERRLMEIEQQRRELEERRFIESVQNTLKKWAQECLAKDDKRQRLLEKGVLKCFIRASTSDASKEHLTKLISDYRGKLTVIKGASNTAGAAEAPPGTRSQAEAGDMEASVAEAPPEEENGPGPSSQPTAAEAEETAKAVRPGDGATPDTPADPGKQVDAQGEGHADTEPVATIAAVRPPADGNVEGGAVQAEARDGEVAGHPNVGDGGPSSEGARAPTAGGEVATAAEPSAAAVEGVAAETRERWVVTFDATAFETFSEAYPEVLEPPIKVVRKFVEGFVAKVEVESMKVKDMYTALEKRFGPLRRTLLERAKQWAAEGVEKRLQEEQQKKAEKKPTKGSTGQVELKRKNQVQADQDESKKARIETQQDVDWAVGVMAPLGFQVSSGEPLPLMRPPAPVVTPVLAGLQELQTKKDFRDYLKKTQIGKAVNSLRRHPDRQVARTARSLTLEWKAACSRKPSTTEGG